MTSHYHKRILFLVHTGCQCVRYTATVPNESILPKVEIEQPLQDVMDIWVDREAVARRLQEFRLSTEAIAATSINFWSIEIASDQSRPVLQQDFLPVSNRMMLYPLTEEAPRSIWEPGRYPRQPDVGRYFVKRSQELSRALAVLIVYRVLYGERTSDTLAGKFDTAWLVQEVHDNAPPDLVYLSEKGGLS